MWTLASVASALVLMPACAGIGAGGEPVELDWTAVVLQPDGADASRAAAVGGGRPAGYVVVDNRFHASLWSADGAEWIDLDPAGLLGSEVHGSDAMQQVGFAWAPGFEQHAALWAGTTASWTSLHPATASSSWALAVSDGTQFGLANFGGTTEAVLWTGSSESWQSLHPPGATGPSRATAAYGDRQGGTAAVDFVSQASLWSGSATSWTSLHPMGAALSQVAGMDAEHQVGVASVAGQSHASLWQGTAESWVDLHPVGATSSHASAVAAGRQVGFAAFEGANRAGMWSGTPGSWFDLHALLPGVYPSSFATGVHIDGDRVVIVGGALQPDVGEDVAVMWVHGPRP